MDLELSAIALDLLQNPERYLAWELLSMADEQSLSNHHLMLLACLLPESEVDSLVSEYRSALSSSPLFGTKQMQLYLHLTTILQGSLSARLCEIVSGAASSS